MTLHFQDKIEIEQIRAIEEGGHGLLARFDGDSCAEFTDWLKVRVAALKQQPSVQTALNHGPSLHHRVVMSVGVLLFVLGILSTSSLLTQANATLNIFWLLGALLGINALSLVLWLLFAVTAGRSNGGIIAPLLHQTMLWLMPSGATSSYNAAASRAWFSAQLNPHFHQWYLGRLTHGAWCCYLIGSMTGLLLLFATREFNFVWESTLLSADAFVGFSQWLAAPLQWLGLATPSKADIIRSGSGELEMYSGALRQQWALFVLGCLAVYGLLPRAIAALVCLGLERRGRKRWTLDLSLPYYRQLRQKFWPSVGQGTVIDPDQTRKSNPAAIAITERPVPTDAHWLGLELRPQLPWPGFDSPAYLGQITDRQSLEHLSAQVRELSTPVAIIVEASKVPDRGLQRTLRELLVHCQQPWLVLIDNGEVSENKWQNWAEAAQTLGFTDTQVTRVRLTS